MPLDPEVAAYLERQKGLPPRGTLTIAQTRESYLKVTALAGAVPDVARVADLAVNGVPVRIYDHGGPTAPLLVYLHGGRFLSGNLETHDPVCRLLAVESGWRVAAVDYRLAPEHRYPAALEDAGAVLGWAASQAQRFAVAGDSAGGNLAAAAALAWRSGGGRQPLCQVLIYPMLDATCGMPSHREFAAGYGPASEDMLRGYREYLGAAGDPRDPLVSPLFAPDLRGLPEAFLLTAEYDTLRDEGEHYAARLREAGVPVTLRRFAGAIHGFFQMPGILRLGRDAIRETTAWLAARGVEDSHAAGL